MAFSNMTISIPILSADMSVVMLSVVMLDVVAPIFITVLQVSDLHFQPSQIFASRAGTYPSIAL